MTWTRDAAKSLLTRVPAIARVFEERDSLRDESSRLRQELSAGQNGYMPAGLCADPPQRYSVNRERYNARGGFVDIRDDVRSFVAGSSNNATDLARFYAFCLIFDQVEKDGLPGDVAELGVYKGHTATLLAKFVRRQQRTLYLLDTFEGFVSEDLQGVDATQQVQFQDTDLDSVSKVVGRENVVFIKGRFPDTASMLPASGQYAIVHVDCDLYAPVLAALEYFYPRLVAGGYLVIHDYASLWWPGAEQAVDEFFADKPESVVLLPDISGSVAVRKMKQIKG